MIVLRRIFSVLRRRHWSWDFGPPRNDLTCTWVVSAGLERGLLGLSVSWNGDSFGSQYRLMLGPLFVIALGPPPRRMAGKDVVVDRPSRMAERAVAGRRVTSYLNWRHVGVSVEWLRHRRGLFVHVKAFPAGVAVEPL